MAQRPQHIELRTSPHLHQADSVETIMRNVVYALLPLCGYAVYQFGLSALALILVVTITCMATEQLFNHLSSRANTLTDASAIITGLLLALTLPPGFPLWMGAVAGFVAIALGKALFGGLGCNLFNPALVGRAFVQAAFPTAISSWTPAFFSGRFSQFVPSSLALPFTHPVDVGGWSQAVADGFSGATPLALHKFEGLTTPVMELFTGSVAGSSGETSALLILICGSYLALRRMLDWRIPVAILGSAALLSALLQLLSPSNPDPLFMLFSGGLMLGAVFMATDMVGSPVTPLGVWVYGLLIGSLTIIIRIYGGLNEGVMYAILLANAASPLIEAVTQPRIYGRSNQGGNHDA